MKVLVGLEDKEKELAKEEVVDETSPHLRC